MLSHELNLEMIQDIENIHDEVESNQIIEHPFHPLSYLVLYGGNSSNQCDHEIFLIHTSLDLWLKEYYDLSNLFVEFEKSNQTSEVDGYHLNDGDLVHRSCPHAIYNLTHFTKCFYLSFQSFKTCQEDKELQLSSMVISSSRDPGEILEPCQICIFLQNYSIHIASLDANSFSIDFGISHYNFPISQAHVSNHNAVMNSSSYKYLV